MLYLYFRCITFFSKNFLVKKSDCGFCIFNINFFDLSRKCISKKNLRYDKDAKDHIWLMSWLRNFVLQGSLFSRVIWYCIEEACDSHYFLYGNGMCTLWTEYKLEWCYNVFRWQQRDFRQWRCQSNIRWFYVTSWWDNIQ